MKKAEEIVKYLDLEFDSEINRPFYTEIIIKVIKEVQEEAIKETVKECAENAKAYSIYPNHVNNEDGEMEFFDVNRNSILSIADKLIKEL